MQLSNRTVLVTGGTSGIGLGLAESFLKAGSRVIVCGRDKEKLARVKENFPDITAIACDISSAAQRKQLADDVTLRFPELDILINNAGIMKTIDLAGEWELSQTGDESPRLSSPVPMRVPGDNVSALLEAGLIPDPYEGARELELQWIGRSDWLLRRRWTLLLLTGDPATTRPAPIELARAARWATRALGCGRPSPVPRGRPCRARGLRRQVPGASPHPSG